MAGFQSAPGGCISAPADIVRQVFAPPVYGARFLCEKWVGSSETKGKATTFDGSGSADRRPGIAIAEAKPRFRSQRDTGIL